MPGDRMVDETLTTEPYWRKFWDENSAETITLRPFSIFQPQFDRWLPRNPNWSAIEIGAYPGLHLLALAKSHQYRPVALDFLPRVHELPSVAQRLDIESLEAIQQDFMTWETSRRFHVVMSLGFIEHFNNPAEVVGRHWRLVEPGGYLVISVPLSSPAQRLIRRLSFTPGKLAELRKTHNSDVMSFSGFSRICRGNVDGRIVFLGPVNNMMTWHPSDAPYVKRRWLMRLMALASYGPRILNWSSRLFSPAVMMVAQKPKNAP